MRMEHRVVVTEPLQEEEEVATGGPNDRDVPGSYGRGGGGQQPRDDWEDEKMDRTRRMSSAHREHRQSRFNDGVPNSVLNHYNNYHRRPTHRVRRHKVDFQRIRKLITCF